MGPDAGLAAPGVLAVLLVVDTRSAGDQKKGVVGPPAADSVYRPHFGLIGVGSCSRGISALARQRNGYRTDSPKRGGTVSCLDETGYNLERPELDSRERSSG